MIRKTARYFMKGRLIVWEGGEGSGKTTQVAAIAAWLQSTQSQEVLTTREPGGTALGKHLRNLLLKEEIHTIHDKTELCLYAADRIQHLEEVIKPALAQGKIVLCDRFTASSIAYQSYGRGLDYSLVEQFNQIATNGLTPDLTIWLNLDVRIGLQRVKLRGESDRFEKAALEFHQRVHQGYQALAIRQPQTFITIEANQPQALVTQAIQQALIKHFKEFDQIQMQSNN
jgi:dTMP kinase